MGFRVRCPSMILCRSSGSPKISRVGFEDLDISEGCAGSADCGAGSAAGAEPAAGAGSGDAVGLGIGNAGGVRGVGIAFELFEEVNDEGTMTSIISSISSSKSLRMNPPDGIVGNS